ncbi:MAG: bifunctional hydroxymethylpyrimidine kinase/phosphomethylpyrimidine kinase [Zetaproteobacteria bacterium]|nr:MAG: bifunctional hydroxymethylpyrimidine kinase/phosphomethylpyrimidine kinase [Zetaproteobacteria bacterium]
MARCLTIGGSDSSGGAGIEADLAIFRDAGVAGCTTITALTAQHAGAILRISPTTPEQITASLQATAEAGPVAAIKTGMLAGAAQLHALCDGLARWFADAPLIVDPVLVASSGRRLLDGEALPLLRARLLPRATVITPNLEEAAVLDGEPVTDPAACARRLADRFGCTVLLKGGHGDKEEQVVDRLARPGAPVQAFAFPRRRLTPVAAHGTGCRYAAAVTAAIARGIAPAEAAPIAHRAAVDGIWRRD